MAGRKKDVVKLGGSIQLQRHAPRGSSAEGDSVTHSKCQ